MATFLYKLGRLAFRRRRLVALIWVALLALAGVGAATAASAPPSSFSIPGTEAQKAFDLLEQRFPGGSADGATARVVFQAPHGQKISDPANKSAITQTVKDLTASSEQVASVTDPFRTGGVSANGTTAYAEVFYKVSAQELTDATKHGLEEAGARATHQGLQVETGGDALAPQPESGAGEIIGIAIAAVVLVLTFGSLIAAGLPLVTAIVGVGTGIAGIMILASPLGLDTSSSTPAMMIGLAVCIDYALFIVSRYRAELARGHKSEDAAGRALGTAGSAVVFAGLTVVIALAGLTVVDIPTLTKMGLAAAGTVLIAVLIALTLVPALLGFTGRRILSRRAAQTGSASSAPAKPSMGTRWGRFVVRRPVWVLLIGVLGLGAVAVPASSLNLGMPADGSQPASTTQRRAYDLLADCFGPGFNGPLLVVVGGDQAAAQRTADTIKTLDGVNSVTQPVPNKVGDTAMLTVVPTARPSSEQTKNILCSYSPQKLGFF